MANEQEPQAGFQLGSGPSNLTQEPPQPSPPKAVFTSTQLAAPPAVTEQFPLYDPTTPASFQSVKPNQTGYTLAEYSRDVPAPRQKPRINHTKATIIGIVIAVVGIMVPFGIIPEWYNSETYDYGAAAPQAGYIPGWLEPGEDYGHQDFRNNDMSNMNLTASSFVESDFREVQLVEANLTAADFTGADLRAAHMNNVTANGTTFLGADLRGATLSGGTFQGANFAGADLRGANLAGADFSGANLADVDFAGATYDDATVWPTAFSIPSNAVKI